MIKCGDTIKFYMHFIIGSASGWGRYDDAAVVKVCIMFFRKLEFDRAEILQP